MTSLPKRKKQTWVPRENPWQHPSENRYDISDVKIHRPDRGSNPGPLTLVISLLGRNTLALTSWATGCCECMIYIYICKCLYGCIRCLYQCMPVWQCVSFSSIISHTHTIQKERNRYTSWWWLVDFFSPPTALGRQSSSWESSPLLGSSCCVTCPAVFSCPTQLRCLWVHCFLLKSFINFFNYFLIIIFLHFVIPIGISPKRNRVAFPPAATESRYPTLTN